MKRIPVPSTVVVLACLVLALVACQSVPPAAAGTRALPLPAVDAPPGQATKDVAVFAGGCFWGMQGVFQHVKGVTKAVSGYTGGDKDSAVYETVGTGRTGHAGRTSRGKPADFFAGQGRVLATACRDPGSNAVWDRRCPPGRDHLA